MDPVLLSRIQFAITISFHFIFPPVTIGLAWLIFWMMTKYKTTNSDFYKNMAKFWIKIFAISFGVGVASGITMEFQFGTNWANYSRFVGDIFGAPLAAEALTSFFLESVFLGILLLGWKKTSVKVLWVSSLMVALGSTLSAFWILAANSWQQTPSGYEIVNGRAQLTNFYDAMFNPSMLPRFFHTLDACFMTGAFFMMGVSALLILKNLHLRFAKESLRISLYVAVVSSLLQLPSGHIHALQVAHTQPAKLAAIEGHFDTMTKAPALLFGLPNYNEEKTNYSIKVPGLLSLLVHNNVNGKVLGLKAFPKDEWPPLYLTFFPFHLMILLGIYFIAISLIAFHLYKRKKLFENKRVLKALVFTIPLPFITNELGWMTAEVGRQPWVVYGLLKTKDAISISVPASQILFTIITFSIIYLLLFLVWVHVLKKEIYIGPTDSEGDIN